MKLNIGSLLLILIPVLSSCTTGPGEVRKSPIGSFKAPSLTFVLSRTGAFQIEHTASSGDTRHYIVTGTFEYTLEFDDDYNETSYGHLDLTVESITLNGEPASGLEITSFYDGDDIQPGGEMLGWWRWMNLVDYGGKMQLKMNVPARGYRQEDPFSGADWLLAGDPD